MGKLSTRRKRFRMENDPVQVLIDDFIKALQRGRALLKPGLSHADRSLVCLDLSDKAFVFGEAFAEQHKVHIAAGLEELGTK